MGDNEKGNKTDLKTEVLPPSAQLNADARENSEPSNAARADDNHTIRPSRGSYFWLSIVFDCLLFIATSTYALVAYFQWQAMNRQASTMDKQWQTMEKSLRVTQRAYVSIHSIRADLQSGQVSIMLENIGKVPAEDVKASGGAYIRGENGVMRGDDVTREAGHTSLFPGTFYSQVNFPLKDFTPQDRDLIVAGKESMGFHVKVRYGDGFGNTEQSVFAYIYIPPPNEGWNTVPIVTFEELQKMPAK